MASPVRASRVDRGPQTLTLHEADTVLRARRVLAASLLVGWLLLPAFAALCDEADVRTAWAWAFGLPFMAWFGATATGRRTLSFSVDPDGSVASAVNTRGRSPRTFEVTAVHIDKERPQYAAVSLVGPAHGGATPPKPHLRFRATHASVSDALALILSHETDAWHGLRAMLDAGAEIDCRWCTGSDRHDALDRSAAQPDSPFPDHVLRSRRNALAAASRRGALFVVLGVAAAVAPMTPLAWFLPVCISFAAIVMLGAWIGSPAEVTFDSYACGRRVSIVQQRSRRRVVPVAELATLRGGWSVLFGPTVYGWTRGFPSLWWVAYATSEERAAVLAWYRRTSTASPGDSSVDAAGDR